MHLSSTVIQGLRQLLVLATIALEQAESTLAKKLQARASKDRLAAGIEDKAPSEYQKQVDAYFKALANQKP